LSCQADVSIVEAVWELRRIGNRKASTMNTKHKSCFRILVSLLLFGLPCQARAVTLDELACIIKTMESRIVDVSVEYEWYIIPSRTDQESSEEYGIPVAVVKDGVSKFRLSAAGLLSGRDPNDVNSPLPRMVLLEEWSTLLMEERSLQHEMKESYDGRTAKRLNVTIIDPNGEAREIRSGSVFESKHSVPHIILSPLGFSVLRTAMSEVTGNFPLSLIMTRYKHLVRLDNTPEEVNGFNTIHADLLQEFTKRPCIRIYFSVDHGYTPVRYEYVSHKRDGSEYASGAWDILSLEEVEDGLWFPTSGLISSAGEERMDVWQATGEVLVNQGLAKEDFDIVFPPGTEVRDGIRNTTYVVEPDQD